MAESVGIRVIGIFFLLFVLGGFAAVVALIALAITKGRAGIAILVGGLAFLGLIFGVALLSMFWVYSSRASLGESAITSIGDSVGEMPQLTINGVPQPFSSPPSNFHTSWAISLTPVIFIGIGVVALLALAARRGFAHSAAGGHGRIWPALVALPLLAFFLVGSVRYQSTTNSNASRQAAEQIAFKREEVQRQHEETTRRVAAMARDIHNRSDNTDTHDLIDKFDSPRIVLQAPMAPTAAPAALVIAAQAGVAPPATPAAEVAAIPPNVAAKPGNPAGPRPAWIDEPPKRTGDVRREVIATEEYATAEECYQAADVYLMLKAHERLQQLAGRPYVARTVPSITFANNLIMADGQILSNIRGSTAWSDSRLRSLNGMGITPNYLRSEIVAKDPSGNQTREYLETTSRSVGEMKKLYMQIEFTPAVDRELLRLSEAYYRQEGFAKIGVGAASVLGLLSMVWGLLKIDTATKGYYTKRLFLGVPAAIIGGFLLLLLIDMAH